MSEMSQNKLKRRNKKKRKPVISWGDPIEAYSFHTLLNGTRSDSFQIEDRQEDAEEFLGVLLNRLNDEMKKVSMRVNQKYYLDGRYFIIFFLLTIRLIFNSFVFTLPMIINI